MFSLYKCPAGSDSHSKASPNWKCSAAPWQISRRGNTTHLGFCIYFPFGTFPRFLRPDFQLLFLNFFWKPPPWTWKTLQRWHQSRKEVKENLISMHQNKKIKNVLQVSTDLLAFLQHLIIHLHFFIFICLEVIFLLIRLLFTLHIFLCRVFYSEYGGCGDVTQV